MQIENYETINGKNSNSCENLNNVESSNMGDNYSKQEPTRSHKETCMLA